MNRNQEYNTGFKEATLSSVRCYVNGFVIKL